MSKRSIHVSFKKSPLSGAQKSEEKSETPRAEVEILTALHRTRVPRQPRRLPPNVSKTGAKKIVPTTRASGQWRSALFSQDSPTHARLYACLYTYLYTCLYTCPCTCRYAGEVSKIPAHTDVYTPVYTHDRTRVCYQGSVSAISADDSRIWATPIENVREGWCAPLRLSVFKKR